MLGSLVRSRAAQANVASNASANVYMGLTPLCPAIRGFSRQTHAITINSHKLSNVYEWRVRSRTSNLGVGGILCAALRLVG